MPFVTITLTEDQYKLLADILTQVEEEETDVFNDDRTPEQGAYVMEVRGLKEQITLDQDTLDTLPPNATSGVNRTIAMIQELMTLAETTHDTIYGIVKEALEQMDVILEMHEDRDATDDHTSTLNEEEDN